MDLLEAWKNTGDAGKIQNRQGPAPFVSQFGSKNQISEILSGSSPVIPGHPPGIPGRHFTTPESPWRDFREFVKFVFWDRISTILALSCAHWTFPKPAQLATCPAMDVPVSLLHGAKHSPPDWVSSKIRVGEIWRSRSKIRVLVKSLIFHITSLWLLEPDAGGS